MMMMAISTTMRMLTTTPTLMTSMMTMTTVTIMMDLGRDDRRPVCALECLAAGQFVPRREGVAENLRGLAEDSGLCVRPKPEALPEVAAAFDGVHAYIRTATCPSTPS